MLRFSAHVPKCRINVANPRNASKLTPFSTRSLIEASVAQWFEHRVPFFFNWKLIKLLTTIKLASYVQNWRFRGRHGARRRLRITWQSYFFKTGNVGFITIPRLWPSTYCLEALAQKETKRK